MRYSKARHFHDLLDEAGVLKHFQPKLEFPPRHVFWDNVKDPDSITQRWEELRGYFERLLNQPEVLACPLVYDELGLTEATILKVAPPPPPLPPTRPSILPGRWSALIPSAVRSTAG